jgi:hypothetical protein
MIDREAILTALFARLQAQLGSAVVKYSRRYLDPNQLQPEEQPALMMVVENYSSDTTSQGGALPRWTINVSVILYARVQTENDTPEAILNTLIDKVEAALVRQPGESFRDMTNTYGTSLGGLAFRCSINGVVELVSGEGGNQAAALIPIEILAA